MSDFGDATWNENGELVIDIYNADSETSEPVASIVMEDDEENEEYDDSEHIYATIDCGGECGGCVALVVDGDVVAGPPFHPHCHCSLDWDDVKNAKYHKSHLHEAVGEDRNSEPDDVLWLKESLEKLGLYEPDARAGEYCGVPNPYPNQRLFDSIEKFRKRQKIKETGSVKPGHWTEVKINEALSKQKTENAKHIAATFDEPVNVNPNQYATFNGTEFVVHTGNGHTIKFDAVSGQKGFQTPEYQDKKDTGPIPEGIYVARQSDLQKIGARDSLLGTAMLLKLKVGGWPGSVYSWGNSRVWLDPSKETNTYGRDKFSIHGGWVPGSIGCIDLTSQMDDFTKWFENNGKDLILKVEY